MTLYIDPPSGCISWQKLERFALKRLEFLLKITGINGQPNELLELLLNETTVSNSDCLIVGSTKDKVAHFILRLLMGGDTEMQSFFVQAETALFDLHFSCMREEEMLKFFQKLDRILRHKVTCNSESAAVGMTKPLQPSEFKREDLVTVFRAFNNIKLAAGSWEEVTRLYMEQSTSMHFSLPFQCILPLVAKRRVMLLRGSCQVPFSKVREVLQALYSQLMEVAAKQAERQLPEAILDDERLEMLCKKLKCMYRQHHPSITFGGHIPGLSVEQVDILSGSYPLCMSTLLRSLRQKHRLGHHARIQLTLFLKELGLPVHHAIALWRGEYSKPGGVGSRCSHSWEKDGGRYTYSIRHLYGLEGARRNYRGHCCQSLQRRSLGCGEEGGCPFSHWDDGTLTSELQRLHLKPADISDILTLRKDGHFSSACQRCIGKAGLDAPAVNMLTTPIATSRTLHDIPSSDVCSGASDGGNSSPVLNRGKFADKTETSSVTKVDSLCSSELEVSNKRTFSKAGKKRTADNCLMDIERSCQQETGCKRSKCMIVKETNYGIKSRHYAKHFVSTETTHICSTQSAKLFSPELFEHVEDCSPQPCKRYKETSSPDEIESNRSCRKCEFSTNEAESCLERQQKTAGAEIAYSETHSCRTVAQKNSVKPESPEQLNSHDVKVRLKRKFQTRQENGPTESVETRQEKEETSTISGSQCFEHALCPSQNAEKMSETASAKYGSQDLKIFKPVQYFELSYRQLLDGLKT